MAVHRLSHLSKFYD